MRKTSQEISSSFLFNSYYILGTVAYNDGSKRRIKHRVLLQRAFNLVERFAEEGGKRGSIEGRIGRGSTLQCIKLSCKSLWKDR